MKHPAGRGTNASLVGCIDARDMHAFGHASLHPLASRGEAEAGMWNDGGCDVGCVCLARV